MPSPFPGMDPFLEHPAIFPDLHDRFSTELSTAINAVLPGKYYAGLASRVWVEETERFVQPDIHVVHPPGDWSAETGLSAGTALVSEVEIKPVVIQLPHDEFRESFVEVYAEPGGERLVTHVELLSISNKRAGSGGRELYLRKQKEIIESEVHLIEIDLLRGGESTIAVPAGRLFRKTGSHEYRVGMHRFNHWGDYTVYPIPLRAKLPRIPIPLLPGDADVFIDLQSVLAKCYETGRYQVRVRYEKDRLVPPLTPEQQAWADEILAKSNVT